MEGNKLKHYSGWVKKEMEQLEKRVLYRITVNVRIMLFLFDCLLYLLVKK